MSDTCACGFDLRYRDSHFRNMHRAECPARFAVQVLRYTEQITALRAALKEACDWAEQFANSRLWASESDLARVAYLRKLASDDSHD